MILPFLYVALGGAIGASLRYALVRFIPVSVSGFSLSIIAVNIIGCALIGAISSWLQLRGNASEAIQLTVIVGILGGFTTFSSFSLEAVSLLDRGAAIPFIAYTTLSVILCLGAFILTRGAVTSWLT